MSLPESSPSVVITVDCTLIQATVVAITVVAVTVTVVAVTGVVAEVVVIKVLCVVEVVLVIEEDAATIVVPIKLIYICTYIRTYMYAYIKDAYIHT